ncbi:MAG: 1-deoxy-D-xylulose-5-phosphate reductoisomerase [Actinobacteria bacterium]|nr:1-deoxy-D-xylulose-5-phosphate reductoisomerase [Actinomycetota bacterium]
MRRVIVLGSTGSIGRQALEVIAGSSDLTVVGLSCGSNAELLLEQALEFGVPHVAVAHAKKAAVCSSLHPEGVVWSGPDAAAQLVREVDADLVLNGIVGFAGLEATLAALGRGVDLALANKESLVCAGCMVRAAALATGARLIPVDSEHSALFQLMLGRETSEIDSLVITASGGPFRGWARDALCTVTPKQALAHPTWNMGPKITIDSATLMNKGLEVIEAHHLFDIPYERIEVVVHPQSIVHSLIRLVDGALLAHLGLPDMRVPISYALHYPRRLPVGKNLMDLARTGMLFFEEPDEEAFPSLSVARAAGLQGDGATCVLNAANEVAVHAFLAGRLMFSGIPEVVAETVHREAVDAPTTFAEVVDLDYRTRAAAEMVVAELTQNG